MPSIKNSPSLSGLTPGSSIEQGLNRQFALRQQDQARRQREELKAQTYSQAHPMQGLHPLPSGDVGSQWGAFFESLRSQGANIAGAPGLTSDNAGGTLPLSLQGLGGAQYGYDGQRPTSVTFKRGR